MLLLILVMSAFYPFYKLGKIFCPPLLRRITSEDWNGELVNSCMELLISPLPILHWGGGAGLFSRYIYMYVYRCGAVFCVISVVVVQYLAFHDIYSALDRLPDIRGSTRQASQDEYIL